MLAGIYYGAMYGGSTTSILMRIPGEAASVMTCIDGYAMARKGRAGPALAIAAVGSYVAGTVSVVALMLLAPPLAAFALRFGPPEYFSLLLLGLLVLAYMNSGSMLKGLAMAALGLLLGMIGIDQMSGYFRFAYGVTELGDGIGVVPVAVGLFGLAEILLTAGQRDRPEVIRPRLADLLPSRQEWREAHLPIWRGTAIGFLIGIIPGSAHVISTFVSYAVERKISKHPEEFGRGAVAGVAGPESANNAATSGAFVPMLALGVPGVPIAALLLAAMMIHGVTPGPLLIDQDPKLFWGFIASMYVGNVILLILNLPLVGLFVNLLRVPYPVLYPAHRRVLDPGGLRRQQQRGRRVDHARDGRPRVRPAQARLRDGAHRAGAGARADDGAVAAPVARDVSGQLCDLRDAADLGDAARGGGGARDPRAAAVHHAVARLALAAARRDRGVTWPGGRSPLGEYPRSAYLPASVLDRIGGACLAADHVPSPATSSVPNRSASPLRTSRIFAAPKTPTRSPSRV